MPRQVWLLVIQVTVDKLYQREKEFGLLVGCPHSLTHLGTWVNRVPKVSSTID